MIIYQVLKCKWILDKNYYLIKKNYNVQEYNIIPALD